MYSANVVLFGHVDLRSWLPASSGHASFIRLTVMKIKKKIYRRHYYSKAYITPKLELAKSFKNISQLFF